MNFFLNVEMTKRILNHFSQDRKKLMFLMLMSLQDKFEFEQFKPWNVVFCIPITFLFDQNFFLFIILYPFMKIKMIKWWPIVWIFIEKIINSLVKLIYFRSFDACKITILILMMMMMMMMMIKTNPNPNQTQSSLFEFEIVVQVSNEILNNKRITFVSIRYKSDKIVIQSIQMTQVSQ